MNTLVLKKTRKTNVAKSLAKRRTEKFISNPLSVAGLCIVVIILIMCMGAPLFTKYSPVDIDLGNVVQEPGGEHIFGTDRLGRDVFSRLLYGGRVSILIGLVGAVGGVAIGAIIGSICGMFGGKIDKFFLKLVEIIMSVPQLLVVLVLVVFIGRGTWNLIGVFIATGWGMTFRQVRSRFFSIREENYVDACRVFGIKNSRIMFRNILPNCLTPIIVQVTLNTASFILQEAGLSFLGFGVPANVPTWGNIINAAKDITIVTNNPWLWVVPGFTIALFILGINFVGNGLRDAIDPNL